MDWDEKAESYINENYELFAGGRLTRVLTRHVQAGIEAVRALRKENEKLQEKLYAENGHAKQFHASLVERTRECDGLGKENEELKARVKAEASRVDQYKDLIRRLDEKIERLEKEKAGLADEKAVIKHNYDSCKCGYLQSQLDQARLGWDRCYESLKKANEDRDYYRNEAMDWARLFMESAMEARKK